MTRLVLAALCGAALAGDGQASAARQPTFRSTSELVEVDAIALDQRGNFVSGLKADSLTLYENGKPQIIQQFFMVAHDTAGPDTASADPTTTRYGSHRIFVMLFDEPH